MKRRSVVTRILGSLLLGISPVKAAAPAENKPIILNGDYGLIALPGKKLDYVPIPEGSTEAIRRECYLKNNKAFVELALYTYKQGTLTRFIGVPEVFNESFQSHLVGDTTGLMRKGLIEITKACRY